MSTILVLDDDPDISTIISQLAEDAGHTVHAAGSIADGMGVLASAAVDLVFLDVRLPDGSGIDVLPDIRKAASRPDVIIITGLGDPDGAELAIQNGAWDYIEKTSTLKQIMFSMDRALKFREKGRKPALVAIRRDDLVGESPAIQPVLENIAIAASGDAGVLITGETGTGKEVIARTIHANSNRAAKSFVVLDCASLPESLAEGELFGHVKGSFTGASATRTGLVGQADGGTLFLDEVGELPLSIQATFLRVLQEKRYRPVGSTKEIASDFRLVAATNRDLEQMCADGLFRSDLYYRIKACAIQMPPLRERAEDISLISRFHLDRLCIKYDTPSKEMSEDFVSALTNYDWPGNIRELVQTLERTIMRAMAEAVLYPEHLPVDIRAKAVRRSLSGHEGGGVVDEFVPSVPGAQDFCDALLEGEVPPFKSYRKECLAEVEVRYLKRLLAQTQGSIKDACRLSGLSRTRLYVLMKEHNISK
ncbi:sigma-54 dependent transcriptional regulator [Pseudodesulfovibrio sp. zrk46]|uniref:sigma-54-dependent transcriptional regulator n=1 Tax=Pseudodesulfovibrio sp. zrk46 TaxID=2725288 RepID=UPI001448E63B|nr:sigma-54 dependent transcriptional regulator [Pseudodesulfovibrio sp. zrk46]QJB57378.1 sigma-54-dependent Fis family transcriptional regulator [Pseudodesulfovibrio sp. zrk46]